MPNLLCPIRKDAWVDELGAMNGLARRVATAIVDASPWEAGVQKIAQLQLLEDNWEGCGAKAPSRDLLASAVGLAH